MDIRYLAHFAAVRSLIAEETRVSMLVGVAVGYELAQTLMKGDA
jgi:hypothetical protein